MKLKIISFDTGKRKNHHKKKRAKGKKRGKRNAWPTRSTWIKGRLKLHFTAHYVLVVPI